MKTKFAIGCLVQWYEVEILSEYIDTLSAAVYQYSSENVIIDIVLTTNQDLEKIDSNVQMEELLSRFENKVKKLSDYKLNFEVTDKLITIADYRRQFNDRYCEQCDVLVWGETDMLVPKQMFSSLDIIHTAQSKITPKYIATFGICKMWDNSWKPLEHPDFTDKPFIDGDDKNWWSLRYTMTAEEMNKFNNEVEELKVSIISPHKFNGCGLVISSEVIKAGVNIPKASFFINEDTSFLLMTQKVLGNIPQYHIGNILLVHNRKHPLKRLYVDGEGDSSYIDDMRKANTWYNKANKYCQLNNANLFNPQFKFLTWEDVWTNE